jgi:hypothetical protein
MIQNATDVIAASAGAGPDASAAPVIKPVGRTPQPGRVFHGRGAGVGGELSEVSWIEPIEPPDCRPVTRKRVQGVGDSVGADRALGAKPV